MAKKVNLTDIASPDDSLPFRVDSLAEEDVDHMVHVVDELVIEDYLATLVQANAAPGRGSCGLRVIPGQANGRGSSPDDGLRAE